LSGHGGTGTGARLVPSGNGGKRLDSNALDLAASVGHWFSPRLQVYAGAAYSFEKLNGLPPRVDGTFDRAAGRTR